MTVIEQERAGARGVAAGWRKGLLAVHIAATAGVLGLDAALALLTATAAMGGEVALYEASSLIAARLVAPGAVLALGTGIWLAVTSRWGLTRYWWVVIKLTLTAALSAAVLLVLVPRLGEAAIAGADNPLPLILAPLGASIALVVALVLAVYKPAWRIR